MGRCTPWLAVLLAAACSKNEPSPEPAGDVSAPPAAASAAETQPSGPAAIGTPAPAFSLPTLDGEKVALGDHRGKIVVLEWFNPECPFVKQSHGEGELEGMAKRYAEQGVVWLAINSNAPGTQGSDPEVNREGKKRFGMDYPILVDADGRVGKAYGAERTPHMYVIDEKGILLYRGAIDNTKGGDVEDVPQLVNHVADAIADAKAGKPVRLAETEAWGCTVKYRD